MDPEEKVNIIEGHFLKASKKKEELERQIDFHKKYVLPKMRHGEELQAEKEFLNSLESGYLEVKKEFEGLERKLKAARSQVFDCGWSLKKTYELPGMSSVLSEHSSEMKVLRIIAEEEAGETSFSVISRRMSVDYAYARLLCLSLARANFIDITSKGRSKITARGVKELEKYGFISW